MTAPIEVVDEFTENLAYVLERNAIMNPVPPKQPPKKNRMVRVSDRVWEAAQVKAAEREETVSDVIRRALDRYIEDD